MADQKDLDINLEMGPGVTPLLGTLRQDLRGKGPGVLVDRSREALENINPEDFEIMRLNEYSGILRVQGNARNIPTPDNSCSSILAVNVMGHIKKRFAGASDHPQIDEIGKSFYEKAKSGGNVIIVETYTPDVSPKIKVIDEFKKLGFELSEEYENGEIKHIFKEESQKHPFVKATLAGTTTGKYALVFKKP
ncbi:MAG TPA: hypothetical protein VG895_00915 [Patescibacteria group bacterium]|nr:hypothetical protein [Patescibacteria group bacterium]